MLALQSAQQSWTVSEFEQIKRCIGGCLGDLQMDVLEIVNGYHPQLDDLENLSH